MAFHLSVDAALSKLQMRARVRKKNSANVCRGLTGVSLSKEKQVSTVISHKKKIVKLTNKILRIIHEAGEKQELGKEQKLLAKQYLNEVVSELTTIASFCGSGERKWAARMTESIASLSIVLDWWMLSMIEFWCTMANSITLDFNKTPFKFFGGDFRVKWREFETRLRGLADRREVPANSSSRKHSV